MKRAALACALLFLTGSAAALQPPGYQQTTSRLWLGASVMDFGYKEFDDNDVLLDREDGPLYGVRLGMEAESDGVIFGADLRWQAGRVDYDGKVQPSGAPHTTRTDERISDLSFRFGQEFCATCQWYVGAGFRRWDRDILPNNGVAGLFERYEWYYVLFGGEAGLWHGERQYLSLALQANWPINPAMTVDFYGTGDIRLDLGPRPGFRLTLPWRLRLTDGKLVEIAPYGELWNMGRSPVVAGVYEPRSETLNFGIALSLGL